MKISELSKCSNTIYLLVKDIVEGETRGGKPFLTLTLTDGKEVIRAKKWDAQKAGFQASEGDVIRCVMDVGEYNGSVNYVIKDYRPAEEGEVDLSEFVKHSPVEPGVMYNDIIAKVSGMTNKDIRDLTLYVLTENKNQLFTWAAGKSMHHDGIGELMYHMYRMMYAGQYLSQLYHANRDLVMAGCLLHDIGKLKELDTDCMANTVYTLSGQLENHITIGIEMVKEYAKILGTPVEVVNNLVHIIASHHGEPEMGAVVRPHTLEAFLVSQCDMLDSHGYMFESFYQKLQPGTMSENKSFGLSVHVYRPDL